MMVLFITQVTWFLQTILTQDFEMNPRAVSVQRPTYFYLIMNLNPDVMDLSSPFPKLSNFSWIHWKKLN